MIDEDWEYDEIRPRELAESFAEKCDACRDLVRFACEIPRSRRVGSKEIDDPPARFRLCSYHSAKLLGADERATCIECQEN